MLANYGHMNRSTALVNGWGSKGSAEGLAGASGRMDGVFPSTAAHFAQRKECVETAQGEKHSRSLQSHALKAAQSGVEMEVVVRNWPGSYTHTESISALYCTL